MGSSIRVIGDYHIFWPDAVGVMAAPTTPVPSLDGSRLVFLKAQGYAQVLRMALAGLSSCSSTWRTAVLRRRFIFRNFLWITSSFWTTLHLYQPQEETTTRKLNCAWLDLLQKLVSKGFCFGSRKQCLTLM